MKAWTIRRRLTRQVLALVLCGWGAAIGLTMLLLDHEINEMLDEELQAVAQTTSLALEATPGPALPRSPAISPDHDQRVLRILPPVAPPPDGPWPALRRDGFHSTEGWRVLRLSAENTVIEVAHSLAWRREELLEASADLLLFVLPMVALLILGLNRSLRQGFAPLEALSATLSRRGPGELAPLTQGLNGYIGRIEALRGAERQFTAHAAHELRTPLAVLRARLEQSQAPEARAALPLLDSLTRRVERLLQLSRSEAGLGLGRGPADLVQILRLLLRDLQGQGGQKIRFDDGDLEHLSLAADPDALAIVLRNLLENALEHGTGPVLLRLQPGALCISNPATAGFQTAVYARRPGSDGMGLGLEIVTRLTSAMGMALELKYEAGLAKATLILRPLAR